MTRPTRQVFLDTETTGLSFAEGHRIIEIGCVEIEGRRPTGRTFHRYLNPERPVESDAQAVHGLTDAFLADKPVFADVARDWYEFVRGAELVIHNASFDIGFLENELQRMEAPFAHIADYCEITDSLALARRLHLGQRNSLDALCKRYGIDRSQRDINGHGALLDAQLLVHVYLAMTTGQVSLFDDGERVTLTGAEHAAEALAASDQAKAALRVLLPDAEELAAHEAMCEELQKKSRGL